MELNTRIILVGRCFNSRLVDALTLGQNVNAAPLRCGARSLRVTKVFKLL